MGRVDVLQIGENYGDVTGKIGGVRAAFGRAVQDIYGEGEGTPALRPSDSKAAFRKFINRMTELVDGGYTRLAFQEVDNAIFEGSFSDPSQAESLVHFREGLRNVALCGTYGHRAEPVARTLGLSGLFSAAGRNVIAPLQEEQAATAQYRHQPRYYAPVLAAA